MRRPLIGGFLAVTLLLRWLMDYGSPSHQEISKGVFTIARSIARRAARTSVEGEEVLELPTRLEAKDAVGGEAGERGRRRGR